MTNSKRSEPWDRLSELPDSLIFHIFWLLPMKDVVRTTVLSSRWKTLWTTTPYLNFDYTEIYTNGTIESRNFFNRALLSWRGTKILKFKIKFVYPFDHYQSLRIDFDLWIRFALEKKVEELFLEGDMFDNEFVYKVPQCVYSCSSLKVLSLVGCDVRINGTVQWSQLKSLTMDGGILLNCDHVINQVLCGAPQLEVFILDVMDNDKNLSIQSSSLRELLIENFSYHSYPSRCTELTIWTPNLEKLVISGVPYNKCLLTNVSSLTHATFDFYYTEEFDEADISRDDFLGETLRQIFPSIQHVEMVSFSSWCIKVLARMTKKHLVSPFSNVKFLKLALHVAEYEQTVGVLEIFPEMKMLVLLDEEHEASLMFDAKSCLKFAANLPKSFLCQLRTFKISWSDGDDSIFPLIEILLKYGSNLEKVVIQVTGLRPPSNSLFLASQKLLNMPRSSPNCTVDFL